MLFVWGTRHYGKVDEFAQQFVVTQFGHFWFLPVFPIGSMWVTKHRDSHLYGHPVGLSGKSIAAAYGRTWGLLGGAVAVTAGIALVSPAAIVAGAAMMAIGLATWRWRRVRDAREQRRAGFGYLALGTGCDPLRMPRAYARHLKPELEARWATLADGRTPADVARLGAVSVPQAIAAYALLRVVARIERGEVARRARADSETILDAQPSAALAGAPYRAELPAQLAVGDG